MPPPPRPPPGAAHAAAAKEGYRLEHFRAEEIPSARRLGDLRYHRGISGVVLVNSAETPDLADFPWDRFCAVSCWTAYARNPVDCVRFNPFDTVRAALERLAAGGCRRPGLILVHDARGLSSANDKMLGSFEHHGRKLLGRAPVRPLLTRFDHMGGAHLMTWFHRETPDGIIGPHDGIYFQLLQAGLRMPEQARYLSLMAQKEAAGVAHFSNMRGRCAEVAVEQLALRLRYNPRGIPSHPMDFVLAPVWVPRKTCPESPQATPAPRIRRRPA